MSKLYKILLAIIIVGSTSRTASAQDKVWSSRSDIGGVTPHKAVARQTFPKEYRLFNMNLSELRQQLFTIVDKPQQSTVISIPAADGKIELFRMFEASNFDAALQAKFPEIRAFSGQGITDKSATIKLSISPQGVQTMVFRANGNPNEYIEPFSQDGKVVAVFRSQRSKGGLPWVCSTEDQKLVTSLTNHVSRMESNAGQLKTMRLAQSVTAEYSNYFGAFNSSQVVLVLAAVNATMARTNGCYEKDLAIHLNLIANTTDVFYYNPATDPYSPAASGANGAWNNELQNTLTSVIGDANYDIGHLFGASGGGGNAGCIGCVCNSGKGRGFTSPPDAIPMGDNFDIDYVAHEVGHQMGANHTFSMSNEGTGVNKEVGSGITIMGYAGITSQDVAPHSIDIFHETSIQQIQVNMAGKSCPVTISQSGVNATPVVAALTNYTIPPSTPFALTGSATDADPGDVLTYCWEQNDDGAGQTGNNSVARENKPTGPNWITWPATTSPTRLMPRLSTILAGSNLTGPLPGGDAIANTEALSNVSRTLNFRLTARDNRPYNGTAVGQTNFQDMVVTVDAGAFTPFLITTQNSAVTYEATSTQTVSWSVGNTTAAPISVANVKISFSYDGGVTFPVVLAASTANDGSEVVTIPNNLTTTGRIKVEAIGNIFFDINNASVTVVAPTSASFGFGSITAPTVTCPASSTIAVTVPVTSIAGYSQPVTLSTVSGVPAGTTVTFGTNPVTPGGSSVVNINNANTLAPGTYNIVIQGVGAGAPSLTTTVSFTINPGSGPAITTQPLSQTICAGSPVTFSVTAPGAVSYQWQIAATCGSVWINLVGETGSSLTFTPATVPLAFRVIAKGLCGSTTSSCANLTIATPAAVTTNPTSQSVCAGSAVTFVAAGTGSPAPSYQWQISTPAAPAFVDIPGANSPSYTTPPATVGMSGNQYRAVISNSCNAVNTTAATLTVSSSISITSNPVDRSVCESSSTTFTVAASGTGLSYQWEVSVAGGPYNAVVNNANYSGAGTPTLTVSNIPTSFSGNRYRAVVTNGGSCANGISTGALLTVAANAVIGTQPQSISICEGAGTSFSVSATTSSGTLTYQWQFSSDGGTTWNNITGATAATFNQTGVPVGQNNYRFRVIVSAGCGSVTSSVALLNVTAYPVISFNPITTICLSDGAVNLSATPAGGTFSGTGVSGAGVFTPSLAGIGAKAITYTVSNGACQSTATRTIVVNECAERHLTLTQFPAVIVYPVPNNGDFNIRLQTDLYDKVTVQLYNAVGQRVHTQVATGLTYGSVIPVHTFNLSNGTYRVHLVGDDGTSTTRGVIIQKF